MKFIFIPQIFWSYYYASYLNRSPIDKAIS
jgi:hypothetical protein